MAEYVFAEPRALARLLMIAVCAYAALVLILRITGKRTLSKMNAFDLIVTVALGSTLATVLLSKDVPLMEGVFAFVLLAAMQYLVTSLSVRSKSFRAFIKSEPRELFRDGTADEAALRDERVTRDELLAAARAAGHADLSHVRIVTLETDGSMSVVPRAAARPHG